MVYPHQNLDRSRAPQGKIWAMVASCFPALKFKKRMCLLCQQYFIHFCNNLCACVCVCAREKEIERQWERVRLCVCVLMYNIRCLLKVFNMIPPFPNKKIFNFFFFFKLTTFSIISDHLKSSNKFPRIENYSNDVAILRKITRNLHAHNFQSS